MANDHFFTLFMTQLPGESDEAFAARKASVTKSIQTHPISLANWAIAERDEDPAEVRENDDRAL